MELLTALRVHRIVAIVRGADADAALRTVLTLAEEGLPLIEVSLSGRDALDVIRRARAALGPAAPLGAGTVLTAEDAAAVRDAGADFVVTPAVCEGVTEAKRLGLPVLAGVMTPSDIVAAQRLGADAYKLFPAAQAAAPAISGRCAGRSRTRRSSPSGEWTPQRPVTISPGARPRSASGPR